MKLLGGASMLVVVVLAAGCAGSGGSKTDLNGLPKSLRTFIHTTIRNPGTGNTINSIDVYGPGSRTALNAASNGGGVMESAEERKQHFYLLVLQGQFVCGRCAGPGARKPPNGTVETYVWSPQEGGTDFGFMHGVPPGVAKLHRLTAIAVS